MLEAKYLFGKSLWKFGTIMLSESSGFSSISKSSPARLRS